ncbi:MAG: RNA-binding domain-containing protein [Bacteroidota bacterium]
MTDILQVLARHEVFSELDADELTALIPIVERVTFDAGTRVFDSKRKPRFFYLIESGTFSLELAYGELKTLGPGQLVGEIGVINGDFRSGTVVADEAVTAIEICGTRLFNEAFVPATTALKITRALSKRITNYLRSRTQISTAELIRQGESENVEFKSTFRMNLYTNKKDRSIEKAALKTICAFLNSEGGILMIGVNDEGEVLGLARDNFPNHDKLMLHVTNMIKERIGALHLQFIQFAIEEIEGQDILRIDCSPASMPAYFMDDEQDAFFIRTGPSTTSLRLRDVPAYLKERFGSV